MNKKTATLSVVTAGVLWGIISIFINRLSDFGFSSIEISFLRVITCTVLMLVFLLIYDRKLLKFRLRDIWMFIGTGIISLTLFSCCYFTTIINTGVSVAVTLLYTSPVFIMLFSAVLFKEKITPKKVTAIIFTVIGCVLVSGIIGSETKMTFSSLLTGVASGFFYGLYSVFGRYASNRYYPFTITFYTFAFASVGFVFLVNPVDTFVAVFCSRDALLTVIISGILCGILPYIFYTLGLKYLDTAVAGILVAVEPLVGNIMGIVFFDESAEPLKITGIVLILLSVVLLSFNSTKLRRKSTALQ